MLFSQNLISKNDSLSYNTQVAYITKMQNQEKTLLDERLNYITNHLQEVNKMADELENSINIFANKLKMVENMIGVL
jgi:hypothetical protein